MWWYLERWGYLEKTEKTRVEPSWMRFMHALENSERISLFAMWVYHKKVSANQVAISHQETYQPAPWFRTFQSSEVWEINALFVMEASQSVAWVRESWADEDKWGKGRRTQQGNQSGRENARVSAVDGHRTKTICRKRGEVGRGSRLEIPVNHNGMYSICTHLLPVWGVLRSCLIPLMSLPSNSLNTLTSGKKKNTVNLGCLCSP